LEYTDDLALMFHSFNHMQEKTQRLEAVAASTGLRINKDKTRIMKTNSMQMEHWQMVLLMNLKSLHTWEV